MPSHRTDAPARSATDSSTVAADVDPPVDRAVDEAVMPGDAVPRLVGLGMPFAAAQQLVERHDAGRARDALDALEELDDGHRVVDPVAWVQAAVTRRWDLTGVLARRRAGEARRAALDAEQRRRKSADRNHPAWRVRADRWATAVSSLLDDRQLARAMEQLTGEVAGAGRRSVPVVRAELVAWAVGVHERIGDESFGVALVEDLERGPERGPDPVWPLPEPPACVDPDAVDQTPLDERIKSVTAASGHLDRPAPRAVEPEAPGLARRVELLR